MFFKYNGDKKIMISYGYDFSEFKTVEVPDEDTFVIKKLTGSSHFDEIKKGSKKRVK